MDNSSQVQNAQNTSNLNPATPVQPVNSVKPTQPSSTNKGLIASIIIVLVVVVSVGVYAFISKQPSSSSNSTTAMRADVNHTPQISATPSGALQTAHGNGLTSGTTNADLTQDASTLNTGLNSASSELNNVDQGLNDQPTDLSQ